MTVSELLRKGKDILKKADIENYSNEARWIFESVFDCSSDYLVFNSDNSADPEKSSAFIEKIQKRASDIPVQYVIGEWDFYAESFYVGEGVLIPRPETELLVYFAVEYLKHKSNPVIFDLCAGTGCIGLTVARLIPEARVYLVEKSELALQYLKKNKDKFSLDNAEIIQGDIFDGFEAFDFAKPDLILSNPPYINSCEIEGLQKEVLREPVMALDGGKDGLDFYKAIADKWLSFTKAVAVECGEGQSEMIKEIFSAQCSEAYSITDFNGIERVVVGRKDK